jgi:hypothetical protein
MVMQARFDPEWALACPPRKRSGPKEHGMLKAEIGDIGSLDITASPRGTRNYKGDEDGWIYWHRADGRRHDVAVC